MAYRIGDRRFPWIARFFEDPDGREPREVSDGPIQHVNVVNPAGAEEVSVYATPSSVFAAGGQTTPYFVSNSDLLQTNGDIMVAGTAFQNLPGYYAWEIVAAAVKQNSVAETMYVAYNSNFYEEASGRVEGGWFAVTPPVANQYTPVTDMLGLVLPYGGTIVIKCGATGQTISSRFQLRGRRRTSLASP